MSVRSETLAEVIDWLGDEADSRFDDPNVAFHSEQLHLWTEDRVYGFMQSDGCAVVVDMPRNPASD